ncbi:hypothetical protein [Flammeovirga aprica]|uniref:Uncharacterized protein n=1 Tax=Flammeovirga aprica JL-4 TaxID=694437 RepID=A0A7X9XBW1_9BACT|nr:hypothetical protein [Flammeovirga aprica]NME71098.1 hypothetical protein [Flammeovirga aprica JL-4]
MSQYLARIKYYNRGDNSIEHIEVFSEESDTITFTAYHYKGFPSTSIERLGEKTKLTWDKYEGEDFLSYMIYRGYGRSGIYRELIFETDDPNTQTCIDNVPYIIGKDYYYYTEIKVRGSDTTIKGPQTEETHLGNLFEVSNWLHQNSYKYLYQWEKNTIIKRDINDLSILYQHTFEAKITGVYKYNKLEHYLLLSENSIRVFDGSQNKVIQELPLRHFTANRNVDDIYVFGLENGVIYATYLNKGEIPYQRYVAYYNPVDESYTVIEGGVGIPVEAFLGEDTENIYVGNFGSIGTVKIRKEDLEITAKHERILNYGGRIPVFVSKKNIILTEHGVVHDIETLAAKAYIGSASVATLTSDQEKLVILSGDISIHDSNNYQLLRTIPIETDYHDGKQTDIFINEDESKIIICTGTVTQIISL